MVLVNSVLGALLDQLIDLDEEFSAHSDFVDNFSLFSDVMVLVCTEQSAIGADSLPVLDANYF